MKWVSQTHAAARAGRRTDDERNHGRSISSSGFEALDQLLHLPYLNVLLGVVGLDRAHIGGATKRLDDGKN